MVIPIRSMNYCLCDVEDSAIIFGLGTDFQFSLKSFCIFDIQVQNFARSFTIVFSFLRTLQNYIQ